MITRYVKYTNYVRMAFYESAGYEPMVTSAWEFEFSGIWKWLQLWCFWFLKWSKSAQPFLDRRQLVTEVVIDKEKVVRLIIAEAIEQIYKTNNKPRRIYIGRKQIESLLSDPHNLPYLMAKPVDFEVELAKSKAGYDLFNVPVEIIPWMDGILVV